MCLLLCALAMRVAVPSGFMLDAAPDGWPRLVACPAAMPAPASPAMHAGHTAMPPGHHRHEQKTADHPCAFSAASAAVDLVAVPPDSPLSYGPADAVAVALHLFARPGLGLAAPPPPKTGPPALA